MKYMLMINVPGSGPYQSASWPRPDVDAHNAFMKDLTEQIRASGELVALEILAAPEHARCVRAAKEGPPITDGVFPEAKEFLAGFWIVDVDSADRAYAIAARASAAPGLGGAPLSLPIEVREVMTGGAPDAP
jgi:hypothetical protein